MSGPATASAEADRSSGEPVRFHSVEALMARMRAIHAQISGEYGWPRMHKELLARGLRVGKERVPQVMQRHCICSQGKRRFVFTTYSKQQMPVKPGRVYRRFSATAPNMVWTGDINTIPTDEDWLCLAAVLELQSRQRVGWRFQTAH